MRAEGLRSGVREGCFLRVFVNHRSVEILARADLERDRVAVRPSNDFQFKGPQTLEYGLVGAGNSIVRSCGYLTENERSLRILYNTYEISSCTSHESIGALRSTRAQQQTLYGQVYDQDELHILSYCRLTEAISNRAAGIIEVFRTVC